MMCKVFKQILFRSDVTAVILIADKVSWGISQIMKHFLVSYWLINTDHFLASYWLTQKFHLTNVVPRILKLQKLHLYRTDSKFLVS
jgi:hypothetical protein